MNCRKLIDLLEMEVPLETAESWDNPGFLVGDKEKEIKKVLVVLDITNEVVEYAIKEQVDFILAHHPVIFSKISRCTSDDFLQNKLLKLISHGICAYGMHTCYDVCRMGDRMVERLGLNNLCGPVEDSASGNEKAQGKGIGITAYIEGDVTVGEYAKKVKEAFSLESVMVFGDSNMGMCVIDAGHYGLEQVFIDDMKQFLCDQTENLEVITYKAGSPYKVF